MSVLADIMEELEVAVDDSFPTPGRWKLHRKRIPSSDYWQNKHGMIVYDTRVLAWPEYYSVFLDEHWIGDVFRENYRVKKTVVTGLGNYVAVKDGDPNAAFGHTVYPMPSPEILLAKVAGRADTSREALEILMKKRRKKGPTIPEKMWGFEDNQSKIYEFLGFGDYGIQMFGPDYRQPWIKDDPERMEKWIGALKAMGFEETTSDIQRKRNTSRYTYILKLPEPKQRYTYGGYRTIDSITYDVTFHNVNENGVANYIRIKSSNRTQSNRIGKNMPVSDGVEKVVKFMLRELRGNR